jgi:hypothetical protein
MIPREGETGPQRPSSGAEPGGLELPAPTPWPMALAFGITLIFAGLVTNVSTTAVGIIVTLAAAVGWWRQVLPVQHVEHVTPRPVAERAKPIVPSRAGVDRGTRGEGGHRLRVPVVVPPISAGVRGGIAGGIAMAVVALLYGLIVQGSPWYPLNLLSAVAMPGMAQAGAAELRAFSGTALIVGLIAHGMISMLVGLLYVVILPMLPRRHMLWGGLVAPLLWTGLLSAVLGVINPALKARVDWGWFVASQIAFGLVAGLVVSRAQPVATPQTAPPAGASRTTGNARGRDGRR